MGPSARGMHRGSFWIVFYLPGALGPGRGWNLNVWLGAKVDGGQMVHGDKVVNVDWNQRDNVDILSFRSGTWEGELLSLLRHEGNIRPFG